MSFCQCLCCCCSCCHCHHHIIVVVVDNDDENFKVHTTIGSTFTSTQYLLDILGTIEVVCLIDTVLHRNPLICYNLGQNDSRLTSGCDRCF
jgi:hypothetical protein